MDVWVPPELNNPESLFHALKEFGAPLQGLTAKDFRDKKTIFQIGVAPVRIDIMMSVPGVSAGSAWKKRRRSRYGKSAIHIIDIGNLIKAKRTAARPQDKIDLEKLIDRAKRAKNINL